MQRITDHLRYDEVVASVTAQRHGIDNTPNKSQLAALTILANKVFEPVRLFVGFAIIVSSGFRCFHLNKLIGGALNSQHMKGEAFDLKAVNGNNAEIFHYIKDNLEFDQLIWEFGNCEQPQWIHVSYTTRRKNRGQVLIAYKENGQTKYRTWS